MNSTNPHRRAVLNVRNHLNDQEGRPMNSDGPTPADLAEIEREWPLIEAELELLDVQLSILNGAGRVDDLVVRRLRHARQAVIREALAHYELRATAAHRVA